MEISEENPAAVASRTLSSSSSAFFSANQSPFFSPRSPVFHSSGPVQEHNTHPVNTPKFQKRESLHNARFMSSDISRMDSYISPNGCNSHFCRKGKQKRYRNEGTSYSSASGTRSFDVYIGFHGGRRFLLRFTKWLCAELEAQGLSCFVADRARCRSSKWGINERAMDASCIGVVIVTIRSFKNPYTIEELLFFSEKRNLVPIFFDLGSSDCLARDIVEKRGDLWEKHGGELWVSYGGIEKEWMEAVNSLARVNEWKLEARDGNWRDCIFKTVAVLAFRLGKRSAAEQITRWKERVATEEFPYPRNEMFIGRRKELSELEFMLFGDVHDSERDFFELKVKPRRIKKRVSRKSGNSQDGDGDSSSCEGKEVIQWKESEKEIEIEDASFPPMRNLKGKIGAKQRRRPCKILYRKGIACVCGESGIGKTELLLEFAHRYHQRYKMVLWIGGESRYIRKNFFSLWPYLQVESGFENGPDKVRIESFEAREAAAISRVRKELMRNIPFLLVIDNLESEKDWWDHKLLMDLLPRFGGETHILISTRLPQVMNLAPLKLSYLSGMEAMSLMQGGMTDYPSEEIDALKDIEEKLGRLPFGLAIIRAILCELGIPPSRLLDTINRMEAEDMELNGGEGDVWRKNSFLLQVLEICFSIFNQADGVPNLSARMTYVSGWFAPSPIPVTLLSLAAQKLPNKHRRSNFRAIVSRFLSCGDGSTCAKNTVAEASSTLVRFNLARISSKEERIHVHELVRLYSRKKGNSGVAYAVVRAIVGYGFVSEHYEHLWAACFLIFGFRKDLPIVELKVSELLRTVKDVVLPLSIHTFLTFSRCNAAMELLLLCTNALDAADQALVACGDRWLQKSCSWKPLRTNAQLNPYQGKELALSRAIVLETRAKLMLRGGEFDIANDLIREAILIRTSIRGEHHPETVSARQTLSRLGRLANV